MKIEFTKMQAAGNDYIYLDELSSPLGIDIPSLAKKLCPRRFAVGADGIVCIERSSSADAGMKMYNSDGSVGAMCGNALRCIGKYLYKRKIIRRREILIETDSGIKKVKIEEDGNVRAWMGRAVFDGSKIPLSSDACLIDSNVEIGARPLRLTALSVGNPHAVAFEDDGIALCEIASLGAQVEKCPIFPDRTNFEIVRICPDKRLEMRVFERGSGVTSACGTGACAAVAAAVVTGRVSPECEYTVAMDGGEVKVGCGRDLMLTLCGPTEEVYRGEVEL